MADDDGPRYTEHADHPDFAPYLSALPRIGDDETAEKIQAQRAERG